MPIQSLYTQEMAKEYVAKGWWERKAPFEYLNKQLQLNPGKEALVACGKLKPWRLTWQEYAQLTKRLAVSLFEMGIQKGEVVAIQVPGLAEVYLFQNALPMIGAVALSMQVTFGPSEVERALKLTEAVGIVTVDEWGGTNYLEVINRILPKCPKLRYHFIIGSGAPSGAVSVGTLIETPVERKYAQDYLESLSPDPCTDISYMTQTSGTTGLPKITLFNMSRWLLYNRIYAENMQLTSDDIVFCLTPQCGLWGLWHNIGSLMYGYKNVMQERFDAREALNLVEKEKVSILVGVPTQYIMLLEVLDSAKFDLSSVRGAFYAGSSMSPSTIKQVESKFECPVVSGYGGSEAGFVTHGSVSDPPEKRWKTVGRIPYPIQGAIFGADGKRVSQGEIGEIGCKGPGVSGGYFKDPENQKELVNRQGWMMSGDLAVMDEDGYVRIVGRKKDVIIRGGQNIAATEIEDLLFSHPGVANVAIVGMLDPKMGEKCCAFIVPKPQESVTFEGIAAFLKDKGLAKFKLPERLEIVSELPLSSGGKVKKDMLRKMISEKLKAEGKI